jgi:hypothetical protein
MTVRNLNILLVCLVATACTKPAAREVYGPLDEQPVHVVSSPSTVAPKPAETSYGTDGSDASTRIDKIQSDIHALGQRIPWEAKPPVK